MNLYEEIANELVHSPFGGGVSFDENDLVKYSTDESIFAITPKLVVWPKTTRDIKELVRIINTYKAKNPELSLTPRAAGTGLSGGSLNNSIIVDVTELKGISDLQHNKLGETTITVMPGAMFNDVEKVLAKNKLHIPVYPASKDICTLVGMVANNAAGANSLKYGHIAEFVSSVNVILADGNEYSLEALSYDEFAHELEREGVLGDIYRYVWKTLQAQEKYIQDSKPQTSKNTAGYALWDIVSTSVDEFKNGDGNFDLGRLFSGSQGTLGFITSVTVRVLPVPQKQNLLAIPVFDLEESGLIIQKLLEQKPTNIEISDALTYKMAMKNPLFFKTRLSGWALFSMLDKMYNTFMFRFRFHVPEFLILATFDDHIVDATKIVTVCSALNTSHHCRAWVIKNKHEKEALWQIRRASYMLSKLSNRNARPAAFLEDMVVAPEKLPSFFIELKKLFKKYKVNCTVHGHGGNGHLHFYPLMDFTKTDTPEKILNMASEFFEKAKEFGGSICGEHNDGIIRTPYLKLMFEENMLHLFEKLEGSFDPTDIFNPGKKVNPKFDITDNIRKIN